MWQTVENKKNPAKQGPSHAHAAYLAGLGAGVRMRRMRLLIGLEEINSS